MRHTHFYPPLSQNHSNGFTLLELLVAITLFAMISTASLKLFKSVSQSQKMAETVLNELDELQRAEIILESDLFQMVSRPIRDDQGRTLPALKLPGIGGTIIEFTRSGWQNPLRTTRSTLQRIAYAMEGTALIRYYWPMLDRAPDTRRIRQTVLTGVNNIKFRLLDHNGDWVKSWSSSQSLSLGLSTDSQKQLPQAIEITLTHEKIGPIVTIVPLTTYKHSQQTSSQHADRTLFRQRYQQRPTIGGSNDY